MPRFYIHPSIVFLCPRIWCQTGVRLARFRVEAIIGAGKQGHRSREARRNVGVETDWQ